MGIEMREREREKNKHSKQQKEEAEQYLVYGNLRSGKGHGN